MIVKCKKAFRHQITERKMYLVIEVLIHCNRGKIMYRIIDNEGVPAIYDSENFEIISENVEEMIVLMKNKNIIITHKDINDDKFYTNHIDGFWGAYFDSDNMAKTTLKEVVKKLANYEKIESPQLE